MLEVVNGIADYRGHVAESDSITMGERV